MSEAVKALFANIAPKYDLLNRVLSARNDVRWRRRILREVAGAPTDVLDLACGTFDLGLEASPLVEMEMLPNPLGMFKDLRLEGVLFLRNVAGFFEQWQIDVGFDVTLSTTITDGWTFNGSLALRWNQKVATGLQQGDSLLSFGLGYKF